MFTSNSNANSNLIYSTAETKCGTWIDGSTIYRKVYQLENFSVGNANIKIIDGSFTATSITNLISLEGTYIAGSGNMLSLPFYSGESPVWLALETTGLKLRTSYTSISIKKLNVIVEYIK